METEMAPAKGQQTVNITRDFDLPVDKVWQAWTDPETFRKWCGPKGYTCPSSTMDVRPGGKYLHCMRSPEGQEFWSTGVFKEILPNKKLVCTDSFSDENGNVITAADVHMPGEWPLELLITAEFEEKGGKTKIMLEHVGIPAEMHDECVTGWQQSFDKLQENVR